MAIDDLITICAFSACLFVAPISVLAAPECEAMELPVVSVDGPPEQYLEFCLQYDGACELEGAPVLEWSQTTSTIVEAINIQVNQETERVSDWEFNGLDDVWDYPFNCRGDCEDIALEKRRRLVEAGVPSAALTMAIALHRTLSFPHAVLLIETSGGTLVLDDLDNAIRCWSATPYTITHRERPDGRWSRFQLP